MKNLETEAVVKRTADARFEEGACRKQAFRLLAFRARSEAEMREALQKRGYPDSEVAVVLTCLKKENYIDDEAYCRTWADYRMENAPVGPFKLEADLRRKGFDVNLIRSVSETIWRSYSELDVALKLAKKRYVKGETPLSVADLRRISGFLQRKGFSGEVAGRVVIELGK